MVWISKPSLEIRSDMPCQRTFFTPMDPAMLLRNIVHEVGPQIPRAEGQQRTWRLHRMDIEMARVKECSIINSLDAPSAELSYR